MSSRILIRLCYCLRMCVSRGTSLFLRGRRGSSPPRRARRRPRERRKSSRCSARPTTRSGGSSRPPPSVRRRLPTLVRRVFPPRAECGASRCAPPRSSWPSGRGMDPKCATPSSIARSTLGVDARALDSSAPRSRHRPDVSATSWGGLREAAPRRTGTTLLCAAYPVQRAGRRCAAAHGKFAGAGRSLRRPRAGEEPRPPRRWGSVCSPGGWPSRVPRAVRSGWSILSLSVRGGRRLALLSRRFASHAGRHARSRRAREARKRARWASRCRAASRGRANGAPAFRGRSRPHSQPRRIRPQRGVHIARAPHADAGVARRRVDLEARPRPKLGRER